MLREWTLRFSFADDGIESIPVWIHLLGLDLEFWGRNTVDKLARKVGFPIRTDQVTADRERILYARVVGRLWTTFSSVRK